MAVADIDVDGDFDVLLVIVADNTVTWYENIDGRGTFGSQPQVIGALGGQEAFVVAADIDSDEDTDVLTVATSFLAQPIQWFENDTGTFGHVRAITEDARFVFDLLVVDIDPDGDQDGLSASPIGPIALYEKLNDAGRFAARQVLAEASSFRLAAGEINGDGNIDILSADDGVITWHESILIAANDEYSTIRGEPLSIETPGVLANDSPLAIKVELTSGPSFGSLTLSPDGAFEYTPNADFVGVDSFSYRGMDALGNSAEDAAVALITVEPVPGDATDDGIVNFADFQVLASNFGRTSASRTDGDFDGDGEVTFADFLILSSRFVTD